MSLERNGTVCQVHIKPNGEVTHPYFVIRHWLWVTVGPSCLVWCFSSPSCSKFHSSLLYCRRTVTKSWLKKVWVNITHAQASELIDFTLTLLIAQQFTYFLLVMSYNYIFVVHLVSILPYATHAAHATDAVMCLRSRRRAFRQPYT